MEKADFIELVRKMRDAQKQYFTRKDQQSLKLAKNLEMQVDAAIRIEQGFDL